ncbi:hypothetical protein Dsin_016741 [Dipteronia sinensis]|uniref:Uncharacterized protein n=1 Tax=Dipteronia sinensis TaxID=43782 RepID=A0AAE0AF49_9ROSI|nr:hypothetical protein Dsin_016741 [Dipteronia sinensis]
MKGDQVIFVEEIDLILLGEIGSPSMMLLSSEFYPAFLVDLKKWYMTKETLFLRRRRLAGTPLPMASLHRQRLRDTLLQALVQYHLLDLRHLHRHSNDDCVKGADGIGEGV